LSSRAGGGAFRPIMPKLRMPPVTTGVGVQDPHRLSCNLHFT
jgi:hypothetical protein